jgi:hypothetical protein
MPYSIIPSKNAMLPVLINWKSHPMKMYSPKINVLRFRHNGFSLIGIDRNGLDRKQSRQLIRIGDGIYLKSPRKNQKFHAAIDSLSMRRMVSKGKTQLRVRVQTLEKENSNADNKKEGPSTVLAHGATTTAHCK